MITKNFAKYGSKIGLVDGLSGREYSFNEIGETIQRFSSVLQRQLGFGKGDVLAIVAPNSPEYAVVYFGTLAAGGVASTCNPTYTVDELAYQFETSGSKVVATMPGILPTVREAARRSRLVEKIVVMDTSDPQTATGDADLLSYSSLIAGSSSFPVLDHVTGAPDDVVVLPYSSGTTGLAKGVMLTNLSVGSNVLQLSHSELVHLPENSVLVGILPFFHIYGMVVALLSSLYAGTKIVTLPKFEPETFLPTLEKYRIDVAHIVPPLVVFLAKHPLVAQYDLTSIKDIITGAAPLGGDVVKAASERTGCSLIRQGYGLTETSPVTHMMPRSMGMQLPSSIGHCIRSVEVKVVDPESLQSLPPGREGEVWIRGPNLMKGYLNNPTATRECLTEDGWFRSGDIGEETR